MSSRSRRDFLASAAAAVAGMAVARQAWTQQQKKPLTGCDYVQDLAKHWDVVRPALASRYHRLHHCFFHYVRNNWDTLDGAARSAIADLQWDAPRPSMIKAKWDKRTGRTTVFWATANGSGEDFLFYHRWMIAMVDAMLASHGLGPVEPWSDKDAIPAPRAGCDDEAVPPFIPRFEDPKSGNPIDLPFLQLRVEQMKKPSFFWDKLNWWGAELRDYAALEETSLGALGARIEGGVHNQMHIRWSAYPTNGWTLIRNEDDFRTKWDDPGYDTLFDEYSSHIGPYFYRLHKWVDNRIEDWAEAHGDEVVRYTTPWGFDWFRTGKWVQIDKPWTGAWGFDRITPDEERRRVSVMEKVAAAMFPPSEALLPPEQREDRILSIRDLVD